jgi:hypothetical protein
MPITANAVAISAQEVPIFMAIAPSLLPRRRSNGCPIRTAAHSELMFLNDSMLGKLSLSIIKGIPHEIVLSGLMSVPG